MKLGKIYQNFFIAAFSRAITALIGLIIIGFLTRHLGQAGYGAYETILSYLFIFTVLADFGLHVIHVREISRYPEKEKTISSNIFTFRLILLFSVAVLAILTSLFLPYSPEIKNGIVIATLFVIFSSLSQILAGIFQKYNTFYLVSVSDIITRLIQLGLVVLAVYRGLELLSFIFILSLTAALQFGIIFFLSRRFVKLSLALDFSYLKQVLKASLPVAASILFTAIYIRTDALMLSLMQPTEHVGIYRLPTKLLETIVFFPALLIELATPFFSELAFRFKALFNLVFKKIFATLLIFAVPIVVFLILLAEPIMVILGGEGFSPSATPLRILALVVGLVFVTNLGGRALIALDLQKTGMWVYFAGAVFNIASNFLVIPRFTYIGASFTTLATEILVTVLIFYFLYKKGNTGVSPKVFLKPLLAGLIMALVVWQLKDFNILLPAFSGLAVYFSALYLTRGFTREDLRDFYSRGA